MEKFKFYTNAYITLNFQINVTKKAKEYPFFKEKTYIFFGNILDFELKE